MKLFTEVEISGIAHKINHSEKILTLGSCFADNIGKKMLTNKFQLSCNPFGIIYNPLSLSKSLQRISYETSVSENELQLCQNYYCHLDFHSQFNRLDKQATVLAINQAISGTSAFANEGLDWLILTLGTSFAYRHIETDQLVANCHKIPSKQFERQLLETQEIAQNLQEAILSLKANNPTLKTILTVSPIRHTKDGLTQNSHSKARLIDAAHELCSLNEDCFYFPAYEIMTDHLRDYRWYEVDLIHPNQQAINFIWEQFKTFALSEKSEKVISKVTALNKNLSHRPFHAASEEFQKFVIATEKQLNGLKTDYPSLNFSEEETQLEKLKQL